MNCKKSFDKLPLRGIGQISVAKGCRVVCMHCEFRVGSTRFFLSEELPEHGGTPSPQRLGATSVAIHLYVDDCDAMVKTMTGNGATVLMETTDVLWGERICAGT